MSEISFFVSRTGEILRGTEPWPYIDTCLHTGTELSRGSGPRPVSKTPLWSVGSDLTTNVLPSRIEPNVSLCSVLRWLSAAEHVTCLDKSSEMWCCVVWEKGTDVSEERAALFMFYPEYDVWEFCVCTVHQTSRLHVPSPPPKKKLIATAVINAVTFQLARIIQSTQMCFITKTTFVLTKRCMFWLVASLSGVSVNKTGNVRRPIKVTRKHFRVTIVVEEM